MATLDGLSRGKEFTLSQYNQIYSFGLFSTHIYTNILQKNMFSIKR